MAWCLFGRTLLALTHSMFSHATRLWKGSKMPLIVYSLVQHYTLICTLKLYLYSQAKFWHVSVADTTIIREDNTTDQKTPLLPGVCCAMHTLSFYHRAVMPIMYVLAWLAVLSGLEVSLEGAYACADRVCWPLGCIFPQTFAHSPSILLCSSSPRY